MRLTKNGSFNLDEEGFLVTKEGYKVLAFNYFTGKQGGIKVPQGERLTADKSGNLYSNEQPLTRLFLAQPKEIRNLTKEGDNLYVLPDLKELNDLGDGLGSSILYADIKRKRRNRNGRINRNE